MNPIEVNAKLTHTAEDDTIQLPEGATILVTPPIDENYWLLRVRLSEAQAVVAFPKFGMLGCGFAYEEDWNTNLPLACPAEVIYGHIKKNKGDDRIADQECLEAIQALQDYAVKAGLVSSREIAIQKDSAAKLELINDKIAPRKDVK